MTPNRQLDEKYECKLIFVANLIKPTWPKWLHSSFTFRRLSGSGLEVMSGAFGPASRRALAGMCR